MKATTTNARIQKKPVSRKAVKNVKKAKTKNNKSMETRDGGIPTFAPVDPSQRLSPRDQRSPDHERFH